jgi:hypothetical protein
VGGKPRIVSQQYLGSAEEIAERLSEAGPGEPDRTQHLAFGDLAGVWGVLECLGVADIIDEVVGSRRSDAALSVGTYIPLAALNRVVAPCSKLAFSDWWTTTAGDRLVHAPVLALDHRRFWDAMDVISTEQLVDIKRRIVARMVEHYEVDVSGLVLDMTNFATYIDSANDKAPIAQRGKAKQKRNDLRLVGLGLVISVDGGIPLVSLAYAGNRHDSTQFKDVVGEVTQRFGSLADQGGDLTVVFDAGQDSEDNLDLIAQGPLHFIGSSAPPLTTQTSWRCHRAATRSWTQSGSQGYVPSRPERSSSGVSTASWSPTARTFTTSRRQGSNRPWPRHAANSQSSPPDWPGETSVSPMLPSRPRSPRS